MKINHIGWEIHHHCIYLRGKSKEWFLELPTFMLEYSQTASSRKTSSAKLTVKSAFIS